MQIKFDLNTSAFENIDTKDPHGDIFIDYQGEKIHRLSINGKDITTGDPFHDHRIYLPRDQLISVDNVVLVRFTSRYVRDCQGVQYFLDKEDNEEYMYSESEPFNQHKGFPCFDQPDIKAPITFMAVVP